MQTHPQFKNSLPYYRKQRVATWIFLIANMVILASLMAQIMPMIVPKAKASVLQAQEDRITDFWNLNN